ncbi:MAG: SDR family oxidoreductase [Candidatus Omnitrophica bacterium]|nr:SDR family oxidoreductase [Candidatus Omnitrophota bacterium]
MRILVTGGAGFIGSHIVERLVREGHAVRVLDDLSTGRLDNLAKVRSQIELLEGDIRDRKLLRQAVKGREYVIHEAAWRSVPKSMTDPYGYTQVNVLGTVNVLESAAAEKVKRLVFASSSSVYGDTERLPLQESQPLQPISPYALSKLSGEHYCRLFARSFGLETVSVRYFNVFGPRQSLDNEYAVVVPKFITCLLQGESPPVYGDGLQSRDFTFIENVVQATIRATTAPGVSGEVFNIACGETHTVLELLGELQRLLHSSIPPTFASPRPGDVRKTSADITHAGQRLGWQPTVGFADGLAQTVAWFQAQAARGRSPAHKTD